MNFDDQFTDEEIDGVFRQAKTLGVTAIASTTTLATARRLAARRREASDARGAAQFPGSAGYFRSFPRRASTSRATTSPVAFIKQNHERITHVIVADRTKVHRGRREVR